MSDDKVFCKKCIHFYISDGYHSCKVPTEKKDTYYEPEVQQYIFFCPAKQNVFYDCKHYVEKWNFFDTH